MSEEVIIITEAAHDTCFTHYFKELFVIASSHRRRRKRLLHNNIETFMLLLCYKDDIGNMFGTLLEKVCKCDIEVTGI